MQKNCHFGFLQGFRDLVHIELLRKRLFLKTQNNKTQKIKAFYFRVFHQILVYIPNERIHLKTKDLKKNVIFQVYGNRY